MREWLKEIRTKAGLTREAAAVASGISKSYFEKIEIGSRDVPVSTAKKIAASLGFDWQRFYDEGSETDGRAEEEAV